MSYTIPEDNTDFSQFLLLGLYHKVFHKFHKFTVHKCMKIPLFSNIFSVINITQTLTHARMHARMHTYTHTTVLRLSGFCPGQPRWASTRRNIHPLAS